MIFAEINVAYLRTFCGDTLENLRTFCYNIHRMKKYIWQNKNFPDFTYDKETILKLLTQVKLQEGLLLGKIEGLGFEHNRRALLSTLTEDIVKSNEIEGLSLDINQVRSSIGRRLGIDTAGDVTIERNVEGIVEMMLDATQNFNKEMSEERLFGWQAAMFPGGYNGLYKIKTGAYRDDANGPMQVVSGAIGHEKVHYEAPPADTITKEMNRLIEYINNDTEDTDLIIKAAIVHLWFVIIHPFEDGNGRIARALTDMLLARSENSSNRFYSMSAQIKKVRNSYYEILQLTQKDSVDITCWLKWFLENLILAIKNSDILLKSVLARAEFWKKHALTPLNERQIKILNKILEDFEGKLTTTKWAKMCNCSQDTATRDITDLINKGILSKHGEARATHYLINI